MGFRTALLGTLALLVMFNTPTLGQNYYSLPNPYDKKTPPVLPNPYSEMSHPVIPNPYSEMNHPVIPNPYSEMNHPVIPNPYSQMNHPIIPNPYSGMTQPSSVMQNPYSHKPPESFNSQPPQQPYFPRTQPNGFTPYNPPSTPPANIPFTKPLNSYHPPPVTPQIYPPNSGFNSNRPISGPPYGPTSLRPYSYIPQQYPPSTQPQHFNNPQHPLSTPPGGSTYNTPPHPGGFTTYNPGTEQYNPSGAQHGGDNSYRTQSSNPHYQPSGSNHPGSYNTYNNNSNSNQSPPSTASKPETSSIPTSTQTPTSTTQQPETSSTETKSSSSSSGNHDTKSSSSSKAHSHSHSGGAHKDHEDDGDPLMGRRIVCLFNNKHYFRNGFKPSEIDPLLCTHVNYEFAILDPDTHEMKVGEPALDIDMNFYKEVVDLKKVHTELKILVSLGGWVDSTKKYSELAASKEKIDNFVKKAIAFLSDYGFDGLDLAWEYPNCWQGAIGVSPKDKDNFVTLLKKTKSEFKKHNLILSVSVGAIKREVEAAYDVPAIAAIVDYINVMTYDMHGPWESVTGHHVQFGKRPGDSDPYCNVKAAMDFWEQKGAPRIKLNVGLAFYAKTFTLADPDNHGMGAPAIGVGNAGPKSNEGGFLLYNEICQFLNAGNWTEAEDKDAGYYAYCGDQWACYDNPMMMVKKAKYAAKSGLGGVLVKDLSGDDYEGKCFSMAFPLLKMCKLEMVQIFHKLKKQHKI